VVAESDLERVFDSPASARENLNRLEADGLLSRRPSGPDERVAFLSDRGGDLLDASRWERDDRSRRPGGRGAALMPAPAADPWTITCANRERGEALEAFGLTERQAGFLLPVLLSRGRACQP
jgi:hypothetical protein